MHQFHVRFHSFHEVQEFVNLATMQQFPITVGSEHYHVNASSLMGMFTLDCSQPICVMAHCSEEEFHRFLWDADRFLDK